jgi:holliday junction DNA helicase RuvA
MLARLTGQLESIEGNTAIIARSPAGDSPAGEAYEVLVPAYLAERLAGQVGRPVTLHTVQYLEQQAQGASFIPRLIGFGSRHERRFFELFTTVKGIGNKKALRAMAVPIGELAGAISGRDVRALQALPEIGKRLAETVIAELHGKVNDFLVVGLDGQIEGKARAGAMPAASASARQAEDALVRLGETRPTASELVRRVLESSPELDSADAILAAAFALR